MPCTTMTEKLEPTKPKKADVVENGACARDDTLEKVECTAAISRILCVVVSNEDIPG